MRYGPALRYAALYSLLPVLCLQTACAQPDPAIEIRTLNGTAREEQAREQLERILETYDLEPWIFTREIVIEAYAVPHSHPVLTLNTKYLEDDLHQLSTFVHEQIHWYLEENRPRTLAAIDALKQEYPAVPDNRDDGGARDEFSTYLHLLVCTLELEAMIHLAGEDRARNLLAGQTIYPWIYARVLEEGQKIRRILVEHDLMIDAS